MTLSRITKLSLLITVYLIGLSAPKDYSNAEFLVADKNLESRLHQKGSSLPPVVSFFLPGFDQYRMGEYASGAFYTTLGVTGLSLAAGAAQKIEEARLSETRINEYEKLDRQFVYGSQLYMFAGEMSAYHSFRHSTRLRQREGEFAFLTDQEEPLDLLLAPFAFKELTKPTTFIPLLVLTAVGMAELSEQNKSHAFNSDDLVFTGGISYNAGVGEEALFRGWIMPNLRQSMGSDFWSNASQSLIFGVAHYSERNRFPIFQVVSGYYLGWLTQRNGWSLQQAAFLHTWWDLLAIGIELASSKDSNKIVPLPRLSWTF